MKVVDMRGMRDLLKDVEELRQRVLQGKVQAWAVSVTDTDGHEAVYLGGTHKTDAAAALRASMAISWAMTKVEHEEEPEQLTG